MAVLQNLLETDYDIEGNTFAPGEANLDVIPKGSEFLDFPTRPNDYV